MTTRRLISIILFTSFALSHTTAQECSASDAATCSSESVQKPECKDTNDQCAYWAKAGECNSNPNYMHVYCPLSCDTCPDPLEVSSEDAMLLLEVANYGKPQKVEGKDAAETLEVVRRTVDYMKNVVLEGGVDLSEDIVGECRNKEELCAFWAAIGECQVNPGYMKLKCAPSCQTCDMIDINKRCPPLPDDIEPGLRPGDLNAMFEKIVAMAPGNHTDIFTEIAEGMTNYSVVIHSRPAPVDGEPIIDTRVDLEQPPWLITFNNFLTDEECEIMINLGHKSEYERSKDVGALQTDGSYDSIVSTSRTSENAWCSYQKKCRNLEVPNRIHERIAAVTGIKANHSEDFQILKYEPGQFYRRHHDYIELQADRQCGPRVLTFFLYLNDVEEGGATNFPLLNGGQGLAVKPKKGQAVLWPSVLNSDPKAKDFRTDHEAQDVIKGIKFGANAWLHLYDYMAASEMGCT